MHTKRKLPLAVARPVLGVVVGLLVLVFGTFASGAAIHHSLHHADSHSDNCAVCSFAKSQVASVDVSVAISPPILPVDVSSVRIVSFLPQGLSFLLPPGRAPPILSVVS